MKCDDGATKWNFDRGGRVVYNDRKETGKEVEAGQVLIPTFRGVWGFSRTRFGGPGEKTPNAAEQAGDLPAQPRPQHCRRFVRKHKVLFRAGREPGRPNRFPTLIRERNKEQL
jgi:hypothetical protein